MNDTCVPIWNKGQLLGINKCIKEGKLVQAYLWAVWRIKDSERSAQLIEYQPETLCFF